MRPAVSRSEDAAQGSCHYRIHRDQANRERAQSHESFGGAAERGRQEKKHQLAGSFRAETMNNTNAKDRFPAVIPIEWCRPRSLRAEYEARSPPHPVGSGNQYSQPALHAGVRVLFRLQAGDHADAQRNKRDTDQSLRPGVELIWQGDVQHDHCRAQRNNRQSVAESVGHSQPHAFLPRGLHGCNVGDCREMVVVKPMAQTEQRAGEKSEFELPVHAFVLSRTIEPAGNTPTRTGDACSIVTPISKSYAPSRPTDVRWATGIE
jgi:hypothetical protein